MRNRSILLLLPIAVAGLLISSEATAGASLPSGVTHVAATAGSATPNIDAHLHEAGSISGTVRSVTGSHPLSTSVGAYLNSTLVHSGFSDSSGHYTIGGLAAGKYAVCTNGMFATGGTSSTGYLGRCLGGVFFNGSHVPSGASKVTVNAGQAVTGKNISLPSGAAIAGKVSTPGGAGIQFAQVFAHNRSTGQTYTGNTSNTGTYKVTGLSASSTGYTVCFNPAFLTQGATGFRPRCYKSTAWNGGSSYPSSATKVTVSLGHTHTGVSSKLPVGGAISGTIRDAGTGKPLVNAGVVVFSSGGRFLAVAATNGQGKYTAKGLASATGDRVCAFGNGTASYTYRGKCWKNVSWNIGALPKGTTAVGVKTGKTHTGISFKLSRIKLGSIAGQVTDTISSQPVANVDVQVYTSNGAFNGSAQTNSTGHYKVTSLPASAKGYVVCAQPPSFSGSPTPPATGWAPRCNRGTSDVAWNGVSVPAGAKRWPLAAGQNRTGVNIGLHAGGEITGTVYDGPTTSTPAGGVFVDLYTAGGRFVTSTSSAGDGTYSFTGVSPASASSTTGYTVCFDGRSDFQFPQGYRPQCYDGIAWNGG